MKRTPSFRFHSLVVAVLVLAAAGLGAAALSSCAGSAAPSTSGPASDDKGSGAVSVKPSAPSEDKAATKPESATKPEMAAAKKDAPKGTPKEASKPGLVLEKREKSAGKAASKGMDSLDFAMDKELAPMASAVAAAPSAARASASGREPAESGLKAGWADDNAQYNLYLDFLKKNAALQLRQIPAEGRLLVSVLDSAGKSVPNANVVVKDAEGKVRESLKTYSDGGLLLTAGSDAGKWTLEASSSAGKASIAFDPQGKRSIELRMDGTRRLPAPVPLDIVFVMDTTGSMGEEIERLKSTVDIIRDNLDLASPRPRLRMGLVLYRDKGDQYVVQSYPLTEKQAEFRKSLATARADGGGDESEDLESALDAALDSGMGWSPDGARLVFVVTDAPAHAYPGAVGYDASAEKARAAAVKIHTIGTGGLPLEGEFQLRQIAQRTHGRYIFLTYGERGESSGGAAGAVSHHTGSNWTADRLETIIIRFAKEELALLGAEGTRTPDDDYFEAKAVGAKPKDAILDELFAETVRRLIDYSSSAVTPDTPAAILPVKTIGSAANADAGLTDVALKKNAEYFGMRFLQAASIAKRFRLVERSDLQALLAEWELRLSAAGDGGEAAKLGELLGAEVILAPSLARLSATGSGEWELSVRLIRVRTGEILSISRARIAGDLGI